MALDIDLRHTAVLSMDFENDIVHPEGVLKEFGFAKMVADNSVLEKDRPTPPSGRDSTTQERYWKAPGGHRSTTAWHVCVHRVQPGPDPPHQLHRHIATGRCGDQFCG